MEINILTGDCLDVLKTFDDNSIDSVVTDPPYGISFMGKHWDYQVPTTKLWKEIVRVLKPGGHALVACGTRTQHRMAVNLEDSGFEIRDIIAYVYGSGFPKSLNIYKQLQKQCTCGSMDAYEKERNDRQIRSEENTEHDMRPMWTTDLPKTFNNEKKQGEVLQSSLSQQGTQIQQFQASENVWGEQPSLERRNNAQENSRKLSGDNLCEVPKGISANGEERWVHNATQACHGSTPEQAFNEDGSCTPQRPQPEKQPDREPCAFCKQYGTQAMGTFGYGTALKPAMELWTLCRKPLIGTVAENVLKWGTGGINIDGCRVEATRPAKERTESRKRDMDFHMTTGGNEENQGRFPANFIHDGSEEVVSLFPELHGHGSKIHSTGAIKGMFKQGEQPVTIQQNGGDSGSASRFFYCAKSSKSERNRGCEELEKKFTATMNDGIGMREHNESEPSAYNQNNHPTVKPITLMRYLCRLVTPHNGIVLDPFIGSGTTAIACKLEGFQCIGIEKEPEYVEIAKARVESYKEAVWK